jgi:hypothetical protein
MVVQNKALVCPYKPPLHIVSGEKVKELQARRTPAPKRANSAPSSYEKDELVVFLAPLGQQGATQVSYCARRYHLLVMMINLGRQPPSKIKNSASKKVRVIFERCRGSLGDTSPLYE